MTITRRTAAALVASGVVCAPALATRRSDAGTIMVRAPKGATSGVLRFRGREYACMLGRSGIVQAKREGDGGTPAGIHPLRELRFRPDRLSPPRTGLPVFGTRRIDGWCDAPGDPGYNRLVRLPYPASAEALWREDHAYDVLVVIGYNDAPPIPDAGSAIFLHVTRTASDGTAMPTAGCISLSLEHLLSVLRKCKSGTMIDIGTTDA